MSEFLSAETTGQEDDQTNNSGEGQGSESGEQTGSLDFIPEEFRSEPWATKYNTPEELFKGVNELSKMIGTKTDGVQLPGEDASEEEWSKFNEKLGVPKEATEYALEFEEGVEKMDGIDYEDIENDFRSLALSAGISQRQASVLFKNYISKVNENFKAEVEKYQRSGEEVVKELWGDQSDDNLRLAQRGAKSLGIANELDQSHLSLNPLVLQLCAKVGELSQEHSFQGNNNGTPKTKEALNDRMKELMGSEDYWRSESKQKEVKEISEQIVQMK